MTTFVLVLATLPAVAVPPPSAPARLADPMELVEHKHHEADEEGGQVAPSAPVLDDFEIVGHAGLGRHDTHGDVWVHEDAAYVGTWARPCTGAGVKVVDVSDPSDPALITRVAARNGTSAEDAVVREVSTASFSGDLLAVGIQRCGGSDALDDKWFGLELWNVSDPASPMKLSSFGLRRGAGGAHELDLVQQGTNVYVLAAVPFSEWFGRPRDGDFRIIDVTDPTTPVQVADWGAGDHGLAPGPWWGLGSFGASFAHSVRANAAGTRAYVSYWDLGVLTFDISVPSAPVLLNQPTEYAADVDGDAHSVDVEVVDGTRLVFQNDEDFDPDSPLHILYGDPQQVGVGSEGVGAKKLWSLPGHELERRVVRPDRQGCNLSDYPRRSRGRIAIVKTLFPWYDDGQPPQPDCGMRRQESVADAARASAIVHDFVADATSPQWFAQSDVNIPVIFTDHATALGMVDAGRARLASRQPSHGYLRVFDAATGQQVASFDDLPNVHAAKPPPGAWSIHNTEVVGERAYASWYSNGVVALDLSPLAADPVGDPELVGRFVPESDGTDPPRVWGVFVRESDGLVFASDMGSGLWIVRPTGDAAVP